MACLRPFLDATPRTSRDDYATPWDPRPVMDSQVPVSPLHDRSNGADLGTNGPSRDVGFQSGDITLAGTYVDEDPTPRAGNIKVASRTFRTSQSAVLPHSVLSPRQADGALA